MGGIFDSGLVPAPANFTPLTPLTFLRRAAKVHADRIAVVSGERRFTYAEFERRCRRFAAALVRRGIGPGDCVAIMAPNVPALLEAHYAVPMAGAVLNSLNTRIDAETIAFILDHGEAKLLLVDRELSAQVKPALARLGRTLPVIAIDDALAADGELLGEIEYEEFLREGEAGALSQQPADEWQAICLLYTSGTTGNPKGVVYSHRGAYLTALINVIKLDLRSDTVMLWTLPMFHCAGWCFTWSVTAVGGTHVCLRKVDPSVVFQLIQREGVTHLCGAPIVLNLLANVPAEAKRPLPHQVRIATGGAAPPSAIIATMESQGFVITHGYGLTESYGPATFCDPQDDWPGLDLPARAARMARQGVQSLTLEEAAVLDPATLLEVPRDGATLGEVMLRGNTIMKGYLKNPAATEAAFAGGWFHSGDLAVCHPDGYIEVKDRSKDIIISGGENISSLEIEEVLYRHPAVLEAAVVARPDEKWGETPCAFVTLKPGHAASAEDLLAHCGQGLARFKLPKSVVFGTLPKTATGKVQKYLLRQRAAKI